MDDSVNYSPYVNFKKDELFIRSLASQSAEHVLRRDSCFMWSVYWSECYKV